MKYKFFYSCTKWSRIYLSLKLFHFDQIDRNDRFFYKETKEGGKLYTLPYKRIISFHSMSQVHLGVNNDDVS